MNLETIVNNIWTGSMIIFTMMFIFIVAMLYPNLREQSHHNNKKK